MICIVKLNVSIFVRNVDLDNNNPRNSHKLFVLFNFLQKTDLIKKTHFQNESDGISVLLKFIGKYFDIEVLDISSLKKKLAKPDLS